MEIFNTNPTTVDVSALFVDEGILRHLLVPFPITAQVGPSTGVSSSSGNSSPPPTNNPSNPSSNNSNGNNSNNSSSPAKLVLAKAKLVRTSRTKASVVLRVNGPDGKVPVTIRFQAKTKVAKGSKRVVTFARVVRTNRLVTIKGLRTPNAKRLAFKVSLVS